MAQPWITRSGSKHFKYFDPDGKPVTDKEAIRYYKSLGIPPAWQDVRIAPSRRAKVLATGIDKAGRTQYIYHPSFRARQERAKFERVLRFARALPRMRRIVERDLGRRRLDYQKVMAAIVSIMDRTHIRVGNESYARLHQSYGLTTMRSRHTTVRGDTITFDFIGKSGQHHVRRVTDHSLARIVRQLDNLPGYEVFRYYDADGKLHDVHSRDVNQYIKDAMGEEFSAKDFRTWAGTLLASAELILGEQAPGDDSGDRSHAARRSSQPDASARTGDSPAKTSGKAGSITSASSRRERQKAVTACVRRVANKLGNTPAIARASYIDPRVIELYLDNASGLQRLRQTVQRLSSAASSRYFSPEEKCVLAVLEGAGKAGGEPSGN